MLPIISTFDGDFINAFSSIIPVSEYAVAIDKILGSPCGKEINRRDRDIVKALKIIYTNVISIIFILFENRITISFDIIAKRTKTDTTTPKFPNVDASRSICLLSLGTIILFVFSKRRGLYSVVLSL